MLHIYFIDVVIMMIKSVASYHEILYAIFNTLHKITTLSSIYFAKKSLFWILKLVFQRISDIIFASLWKRKSVKFLGGH